MHFYIKSKLKTCNVSERSHTTSKFFSLTTFFTAQCVFKAHGCCYSYCYIIVLHVT